MYVAAGLAERADERLYNAAVLVGPDGQILSHHRKINEPVIGFDLYAVGDRLGVAETEHGTLGLDVHADSFGDSLGGRQRLGPALPALRETGRGRGVDRCPFGGPA